MVCGCGTLASKTPYRNSMVNEIVKTREEEETKLDILFYYCLHVCLLKRAYTQSELRSFSHRMAVESIREMFANQIVGSLTITQKLMKLLLWNTIHIHSVRLVGYTKQ